MSQVSRAQATPQLRFISTKGISRPAQPNWGLVTSYLDSRELIPRGPEVNNRASAVLLPSPSARVYYSVSIELQSRESLSFVRCFLRSSETRLQATIDLFVFFPLIETNN
ncbi:hypothetical protein F0562_015639 [Nyssa sinensis]|uniref:Uncharacterized protein n=1 Tax=Nyssa sinensis TaxID=561372 RepID=A0A5J4ZHY5_9ASTE|nr:hypothetical protein F0562_015639 [Nyssa sinensis]